jgi:hypothetical protein
MEVTLIPLEQEIEKFCFISWVLIYFSYPNQKKNVELKDTKL